jgi:hypothetical protein
MRRWPITATIAALVAVLALPGPLRAQDRSQGRSMVISQYGIVAAEQPIAARAGTAVLENGGNAIDAAIAANAAMGLVAPMMNGIGGDLFAIVYAPRAARLTASTPPVGRRRGSRSNSSPARDFTRCRRPASIR